MPLRPWNLAPQPVYSLAVYEPPRPRKKPVLRNLHICTYVTPISLRPKLYLIAIYHGTRTHQLITQNPQSPLILQLLHIEQMALVPILGQRSGFRFDKAAYLSKNGLLSSWRGYPVLSAASAYILLEAAQIVKLAHDAGDHDCIIARTVASKSQSDPGHVLTTHHLIEKQIILAPRSSL